jgi:hypothetical protein
MLRKRRDELEKSYAVNMGGGTQKNRTLSRKHNHSDHNTASNLMTFTFSGKE